MDYMLYLLIGVIFTYVWLKYCEPYLDIFYERFTYRQSVVCTKYQLEAQTLAKEFENEYGEKNELTPAIGYHMDSQIEQFEDDCEDKKIGFIK